MFGVLGNIILFLIMIDKKVLGLIDNFVIFVVEY